MFGIRLVKKCLTYLNVNKNHINVVRFLTKIPPNNESINKFLPQLIETFDTQTKIVPIYQ